MLKLCAAEGSLDFPGSKVDFQIVNICACKTANQSHIYQADFDYILSAHFTLGINLYKKLNKTKQYGK